MRHWKGELEKTVTRKSLKSLLALCAMALLSGAIFYFLVVRNDSDRVEGDSGKTEAIAAAAGARVLPTDPKLKIEPK
jgi:hypothetical protein